MDRRRARGDPEGPGRFGAGSGWDRFEEGVDRLRDRDRCRFEDRIDRQGEFRDRLDERLARIEDSAERILGDRGKALKERARSDALPADDRY